MELADKMAEHVEDKGLELIRKRVTAFGTFSVRQFRIARVPALEAGIGNLVYQLETEILCQSRGNQQQIVKFWVPTSWWQHLKQTFLRLCVGGLKPDGVEWWRHDPKAKDRWFQLWFWRWIGRHISIRFEALEKTVEWEVLDSYPMADIEVPENFGAPVRVVIPQAEVSCDA